MVLSVTALWELNKGDSWGGFWIDQFAYKRWTPRELFAISRNHLPHRRGQAVLPGSVRPQVPGIRNTWRCWISILTRTDLDQVGGPPKSPAGWLPFSFLGLAIMRSCILCTWYLWTSFVKWITKFDAMTTAIRLSCFIQLISSDPPNTPEGGGGRYRWLLSNICSPFPPC